ncbi:MAG: O-antigen ligase family protein, partial [Endomicrobiia bacterium]
MKKSVYYLFLTIFCIFFLIVPIVPDIQISRPKLLVIEILSYILFSSFVIYSLLGNKIVFRNNKFVYFTFLFLGYIVIRYIFSSDKLLAFNELRRWSLSIWLFFAISLINKKHYKRLFNFFVFGSFLAVIYGLLQHYGGTWILQVPKYDRVMSMFGNPIFFAAYLINFLPVIFGLYIVEEDKNIKFLYFLVLVISLIVLYHTKTRAAFLGIFFAGMFFVYNIYSSKSKLKYLLIILIIFFIFVLLSRSIWLRQQAHLLIWRDTLKMWVSKPLFGIGLGKFHTEFVNFASEELRSIWPEKNFIINDAHNEYVQFLAENGIVGFLVFVLVIFLFFNLSFNFSV